MADRWDDLTRRAGVLAGNLEGIAREATKNGGDHEIRSRLSSNAAQLARGLESSLKARDRGRSLERAQDLEWSAERLDELSSQLEEILGGAGVGSGDLGKRITGAHTESTALREALEQMGDRLSAASPQVQQATMDLARRQTEIRERTTDAAERAERVSPDLPMGAPGLSEGVRGAEQEMGRAQDDLENASPASAEGSERLAADRLAEAQRALQKAKKDAMELAQFAKGQGGEGMAGRKDGRPRDQGNQGSLAPEQVELPRASEFKTPQDYRRALLQGMEGDVPKEYEALKRRYYEELVRQ